MYTTKIDKLDTLSQYSCENLQTIPCKKGIYFHYYKDELIYVGKATSSPNGGLCNPVLRNTILDREEVISLVCIYMIVISKLHLMV
jgi:hypothetical protein